MSLIALLTASSLALLKPNLTVLMIFWACRPIFSPRARISGIRLFLARFCQMFRFSWILSASLRPTSLLRQSLKFMAIYKSGHHVSSHIRRSFCFSVRWSERLPATYFVALIFWPSCLICSDMSLQPFYSQAFACACLSAAKLRRNLSTTSMAQVTTWKLSTQRVAWGIRSLMQASIHLAPSVSKNLDKVGHCPS